MSSAEVIRTEQDDTIVYTAMVDGIDAAELTLWVATREVANVETRQAFQRQGLARLLWDAANAEAECYHAPEAHRTAQGAIFANAVGGQTIAADLAFHADYEIDDTDDDEEF